MKTKIIAIALILFTSILSAGQIQPLQVLPVSDDAKATGGVINDSAKLIVENGAFLVVSGAGNYFSAGTGSAPGAGTINLSGNFVNNNTSGQPIASNSTVNFSGTVLQTISGSPITFGNVSFTNPVGIDIACDTQIAGNLNVDADAGTIAMTDFDFGVTGTVTGTPEIVVTGSGAVGNVGANANISIDSPQPTGLPSIMNTLDVNPGAANTYNLPNSTSVANLTFISGGLMMGANTLLLRDTDLALSGAGTLRGMIYSLSNTPGFTGDNGSINKTWSIAGSGVGNINITFRWQDGENNGNIFTSGTAHIFRHNGSSWINVANGSIEVMEGYNTITMSLGLGAKADGDYTINGDDQTLPVELSSFTALPSAQMNITLNWTTQSETGMCGYYVYRNTNNSLTDAINLNRFVSAENSSGEHTYTYTDEDILDYGIYYYWLQAMDTDGSFTFHGPVSVILEQDNPDTPPQIPTETRLQRVYPNPFNPTTTFSYSLETAQTVSFTIYNSKGQRVQEITRSHAAGGNYQLIWDGRAENGTALSSGIYQVVFRAGNHKSTCKVSLLK
jgi:hypothetical protein